MRVSEQLTNKKTKVLRDPILIFRDYNLLRVQVPKDRELRSELANVFRVDRLVVAKEGRETRRYTVPEPCYQIVGSDLRDDQFYIMGAGFLERLIQLIRKHGYRFIIRELHSMRMADVARLVPDIEAIDRISWRDNQRAIIDDMLENYRGQYIASTGSGKSHLIRQLFTVFPDANILVTTYSSSVLLQLYERVVSDGGAVAGIFSSKKKLLTDERSMFVSLDSLHHYSRRVWDIVVLDEKHEACTLKRLAKLFAVKTRRAYAVSAEESDRADKADMWAEAMFGPVRTRHSHVEAVKQGDVVPVKVKWVDNNIRDFPALKAGDVNFERNAVWLNEDRNSRIAEEAQWAVENLGQTMVYVRRTEHALVLQRLLGCPVVHGDITKERVKALAAKGIISRDYTGPSDFQRALWMEQFSKGELPLVIATSVWKRGVDFPNLRCVVRADASASVEDAVQVTGRVSRKYPGKKFGVIIDFKDRFHGALLSRANSRKKVYQREGYHLWGLK